MSCPPDLDTYRTFLLTDPTKGVQLMSRMRPAVQILDMLEIVDRGFRGVASPQYYGDGQVIYSRAPENEILSGGTPRTPIALKVKRLLLLV